MSKTLISYFSRADENYFGGTLRYIEVGNTEVAVGQMKDLVDADVYKIQMETPYSAGYKACVEEAKKDWNADARPKIVGAPEQIDGYDRIILAYPNYCGTMPMAVFTFLEMYDFSGKTILPLCTNEGSGMGSSEKDIQRLCPGAVLKKGLSVRGSEAASSKELIAEWLKESEE